MAFLQPTNIIVDNPNFKIQPGQTTSINIDTIIKEYGDEIYELISNFFSGPAYIEIKNAALQAPKTLVNSHNFRLDLQQSISGDVDNYQIQINKASKLFKPGDFTTVFGFVFNKPPSNQIYKMKAKMVQAAVYMALKRKSMVIFERP